MSSHSVGIFDSGVGGLSVLSRIRTCLPHENLMYLADSGAAPYGDKGSEFVTERVLKVAEFFQRKKVKLLVMACNTATTAAVKRLREHFDVPVVAIEPAIKPAAKLTTNGKIGLLATQRTLATERLKELTLSYAKEHTVLLQACPGLVELVEEGAQASDACQELLVKYLTPMMEQSADTVVLGCTHYPFLEDQIQHIMGAGVTLVDPAEAVAKQVKRVLIRLELLNEQQTPGLFRCFTTGELERSTKVISQLSGEPVKVEGISIP